MINYPITVFEDLQGDFLSVLYKYKTLIKSPSLFKSIQHIF